MPLVRIEFDDVKVKIADAELLSNAVRAIVSEVTNIADVFVYANSAQIKIQVSPIEIFVEISEKKVLDAEVLFQDLREKISEWKKLSSFAHPINFTLIPMRWKFAVDI